MEYELKHKNLEDELYKYDDVVLSTIWGPTYTLKELQRLKIKLENNPDNKGMFYIREV